MAERSTAAVDVANESGAPPLTAGAGGATVDGATAQSGAQDADRSDPEEGAEATPTTEPPELHSGHKLARRYRLEECLTQAAGFSSWRAVDEKLRRAVGVHVMPADSPRARNVLAAARSAALLGDPRFVQVLDAVEENDLVYVVHEWLPDATELTPLLAAGPMEPHEAYQLVSQLSQAMAVAHREGLAHLRLNPGAVLRTETGQYRIRGLAVAAALRGVESDRPKRTDTEAIGALLYAALTARWPYPDDAHGLTGLPKGLGLVAPDQVRAGVHRGLSDIAMRALVNDGATPSRQEKPVTTPEELAKAVAGLPKIRPPEPQAPPFPQVGYRQPPARPAQPQQARPVPAAPPPPALPGRTGTAVKWGVAALLIAALGLGSWQIADTLMNRDNGAPTTNSQNQKPTTHSGGGGTAAKRTGKPLPIVGALEYAPDGTFQDEGDARATYDGKPDTYWHSHSFDDGPELQPSVKKGVGLIYDLGSTQKVTGAEIGLKFGGDHTTVSLYASDEYSSAASMSSMRKLGTVQTSDNTAKFQLGQPAQARYLVIWLTAMPYFGQDNYSKPGYKQGITEVSFTGQ
ncbi:MULTISPECIES: protein kinase family protein [Streptomycetaceae]|uniref:non-specific serine/threonine protein kinase n=1 Tax=Streptantibioticus cattleyicolor (strain ATCC 35852 / DSM 46488 / JCM 4925 / NBRC 14057 / NRRL 8057) TaxID=1003195 RepID=F8K2U1_STREN|nr:protein kinase family protein [Streptantibioticus cattleyicolor]AEW95497.1 hypothetical protein SCATT_31260 [Streptantibioticus cattleyicolor NRRL 8057 = DSM 46488]MYS60058.1 serine/threonine protein kinase [Streptomyces sp. SID5468]CCB75837.1 conserved protein of unknown function [Streptantibioticus cattleyicolor NRRL 8057 = DSM 46488]